MRVLYDESHNQTWTADPLLALALSRRSNEAPRYYSYAHVAELVRSTPGGEAFFSPEAQRALQVVRELVNQVKREVVIDPGCLLVLDNRRCVHARSDFRAYFDGRDRWLQRMAVVRDLEPSHRDWVRGTRVIAIDFTPFLEEAAARVPVPLAAGEER